MRRASRPIRHGITCSVRYAATDSSRPLSVASPSPWTLSSVVIFNVTKLRPGQVMMTLASTIFMASRVRSRSRLRFVQSHLANRRDEQLNAPERDKIGAAGHHED